ncbi:unnamed protein product [Parascedosporium putredinis]|uniref:Amidohydrolase 3 domain-containing protein n=1 Tax=Parascedosporium putredinis TaxID=1442378 RepID=A0A9P1MA77_9PEZI|nr:unnamed protein product [Parascedosporium putredinis]CAI7996117.1 unnamed protein product [Parascedosporium putredinis]
MLPLRLSSQNRRRTIPHFLALLTERISSVPGPVWIIRILEIARPDQAGTLITIFPHTERREEQAIGADVVIINGRVHTMDTNNNLASAVAIKDGKFVYVGAEGEELPLFIGEPRIIDVGGRLVFPGIIDSHNHIVLMGNRPGHHTPLENAYSVADVQETYEARARDLPVGEFVTTIGGFHINQFAENRLPTLQELDEAAPEHPVYISQSFFGPSITNTLGKAFFEAADPHSETGKALFALRELHGFEDRKRGVKDAMAYAASLGDNYEMHKPWLAVYDEGEGSVRLRINYLHFDDSLDLPSLEQRLKNSYKFFGNDMVRTGGIGEFISANQTGGPLFDEAARRIAQAGWRVEVHSLTSTDFKTEIEAFEAVNTEHSIQELRWVVAHVPLITDEYLERLKAIGGGVTLTGYLYLAGRGPKAGPPFRAILDSGIPVGMSSDGMQIAPMNPWVHAYYATTGKNALGELINEGQQITRQELLELYTSKNQWFLGGPDEKLLGAIEVGRLGDLIVLNDDYFFVEDEELKKLRSVLTIVGGNIVHSTGKLVMPSTVFVMVVVIREN